ncbi:hypothetical protein ACVWXN_004236 [Bradyrhizobium sp. i1.4.4]
MPVFARRRLQSMLEGLAPLLSPAKANDILSRLEHKNAKDALAAEVELGLLWSISQVAHLEIEPVLVDTPARPDAFSRDLFARKPAVIEITAISDDTFSGQADMDRAANIISQFANRIRKGAAQNLHFQFMEGSRQEKGRRKRIRRITPAYKLTPDHELILSEWLKANDWPNPEAIRLTDPEIDVVIRWKKYVHPHGRTFSSMPPVADHVEDNPVFKALERKERQLSKVPSGTLKCIFLGDAGCRMLRELRPMGAREVSGEQVINYFLAKSTVDIVCVFSPYRALQQLYSGGSRAPQWKVSIYPREQTAAAEVDGLTKMAAAMPKPQLEGYQARSWHQQGMFDPQGKGIYLGCEMTSNRDSKISIKISARLILEFLAGRITQEQFQYFAFRNDRNLFDHWFKMGMTIQSARLEKGGLDEDDDHLVFDMEPDFGAMALRIPVIE